jgi:5-methyltetrahydrofolate--homocysteine methyltransferase
MPKVSESTQASTRPPGRSTRAISLTTSSAASRRDFRGIRPAFGYPASPDHTLKHELFDLLGAGNFGMALTESFAMTPAASVSGMLFANPASRYFTVGRINKDQVADYARRRGEEIQEAERWLRPNLAYDPQ